MDKSRLKILLKKHADDLLNTSERLELDNWYLVEARAASPMADVEVFRQRLAQMDAAFPFAQEQAGGYRTKSRIQRMPLLYKNIIAAASILIIAAFTFIYLAHKNVPIEIKAAVIDVLPGSNKAMLTLSNGKKIRLSDANDGELAKEAGVIVSKTASGELTYIISAAQNEKRETKNAFNTLTTAKGETYSVVLPDGSKVWLNAASSLKYPTNLASLKERRVELTGEAYFEIAKVYASLRGTKQSPSRIPFIVNSRGQQIEVLGTHFNVNSYADEKNVTTTLEQGSVKVTAGRKVKIIKPGEQALLGPEGEIKVQDADMRTALAWKEGKIIFRDADIQTIMRQVSRWYDLEIVYTGKITDRIFNGGVERTANLSSLLKILELNEIYFKLVNEVGKKKLIVQQ